MDLKIMLIGIVFRSFFIFVAIKIKLAALTDSLQIIPKKFQLIKRS